MLRPISQLLRKLANAGDFDSENLFPPLTFTEALEDAATGSFEALPQKTLRERQYGSQPLVIRPKYEGDFLEKLRNRTAGADPANIYDYTMPSEMLKHQEQPVPNTILDDFYEINRLDDDQGAGMDVLRDYYDRGWDDNDAPEISEDNRKCKRVASEFVNHVIFENDFKKEQRRKASVVVSKFLAKEYPVVLDLDPRQDRTAVLLTDLRDPKLFSKRRKDKTKNWHEPNIGGVSTRLAMAKPNLGLWVFETGSKGYTTTFQFIPNGNIKEVNRLHVRVSCTCPSWLYWGAQWWAYQHHYLYGKIEPVLAKPSQRDPTGAFTICKHVAACIKDVYNYKIGKIAPTIKDKLKAVPKFEVSKELPRAKVKIPPTLRHLESDKLVKDLETSWPELKPVERKKGIMSLRNPDEVAYFAYRFPETATQFVDAKLRDLEKKPEWKRRAEEFLYKIEEHMDEHELKKAKPAEENKIPSNLKEFDRSKGTQRLFDGWDKKNNDQRKMVIEGQWDPKKLSYIAYKYPDDPVVLGNVLTRLEYLSKDVGKSSAVRKSAEQWLDTLMGGHPLKTEEPEDKTEEVKDENIPEKEVKEPVKNVSVKPTQVKPGIKPKLTPLEQAEQK